MSRNINQLSTEKTSDKRFLPPEYPYFDAIIEDIVINEEGGTSLRYSSDGSNLGEARIRVIPDDRGVPVESLRRAYPLEANVQEYPLIGEPVLVFKTFGGLYYSRPLNYTRKISQNAVNLLRKKFSATKSSVTTDIRELASRGAIPESGPSSDINDQLGKYFPEEGVLSTKSIRPCEGDVLVQGRFGNAIRIGSSLVKTPLKGAVSPNILLTAGFWTEHREVSATVSGEPTDYSLIYENINKDKSSIWMVSNQKIDFIASTALSTANPKAHLLSSPNKTTTYTGAQIFVNSDRVILNSKQNEISLFSNTEINLSARQAITVDTEQSIFLRAFREINIKADDTITLEAKQLALISLDDLGFKTNNNFSIVGNKIFIGKHGDVSQPMVLGATLSAWLQSVLTLLLTPAVVVTATGPASFNPAVLAGLTALKSQLGSSVTPQLAVFNSRANFTSETNSV